MFRTLNEWRKRLNPTEIEALQANNLTNGQISSNEALEAIVNWNGGIASAYEAKSIISRVYGIKLE